MGEALGTRAAWRRYTKVAIVLHWAIAALILYNLLSGLGRGFLPRGFFQFHVSTGLTILILSIARVVWRLTHKPPPFLPMKRWEAKLGQGVHFLFYAMMLLLPLNGWAMISASPPVGSPGAAQVAKERAEKAAAAGQPAPAPRRRQMLWGVLPIPMIAPINEIGRAPEGLPEQEALHEQFERTHLLGGWIMLTLLLLHVGGALKHQLADREPELARMGLGRV